MLQFVFDFFLINSIDKINNTSIETVRIYMHF